LVPKMKGVGDALPLDVLEVLVLLPETVPVLEDDEEDVVLCGDWFPQG
jgi:hypothetical protein